MVRHIVMFRLKDFGTPEEKRKAAEILKSELLRMKTKIPVIREFEVGINVTDHPSAYDVVINSTFESLEDLETYRVHPDHQAFIHFNKNYTESKALIDYIIP